MYKGTKRQIAQSIQDYLANGKSSNEIHVDIRDIYVTLDRLLNKHAKLGLFENMQLGDRNASDCYVATFENVPIYWDAHREKCYSMLPARYMTLPHGRGIDLVWANSNMEDALWAVPRNFLSSFGSSPAKGLGGNAGYWVEGVEKIFYTKKYDVSGVDKMDMRLVITSAASISVDAVFPIDPSMEQQIVEEAIAFHMPNENRGQDTVADNKRTPTSTTFDTRR